MKLQFTIDYRILKACEAVASRDDTRYTLCGVLVEIPSDSHVILVASDARSLFSIRVRVDVRGFTEPRQYIIPIGLVEMLSGFRQGGFGMVTVEIEQGVTVSTTPTITIIDHNARDVTAYSRNAIVGIYPDWRMVASEIDAQALLPATDAFRAEQLSVISRAADILSGTESSVSLWSTGPMKPIVIKSDWMEHDVFALLMPVRIRDLSSRPNVPEWTKRLPLNNLEESNG